MNSFVFQTTGTIINDPGISARLDELVREKDARHLILVTDSGIVKSGIADKVAGSLSSEELGIVIFDKVEPDPPESMILQAVQLARENSAELVIGLGGGSSLDTAKLVAVLAQSEQKLEDIYGVGLVRGKRLPLILIPTTAGTGSEVTPISIVTTQDNQKMGVVSSVLLPDIAVLDAELTLGLPPAITAATGVDAMVHAIEAYTTRKRKNPISDMLAIKALSLLALNIETAVKDGNNLEARSAMLLGSMMAGQAFSNAPVAAVHALAYPIGGRFHVPHGLSNSLMLTHVMRFNASISDHQYAELAKVLLSDVSDKNDRECSNELIDWLEKLILKLGLETTLRQVGIAESDLEMLASDAVRQERLLVNNPRRVTYDDALAIYKEAY